MGEGTERERERFDDVGREGERDRFAGENGETIYNLDWIEEWLAGKSRVINKIMSGGITIATNICCYTSRFL